MTKPNPDDAAALLKDVERTLDLLAETNRLEGETSEQALHRLIAKNHPDAVRAMTIHDRVFRIAQERASTPTRAQH